MTDRLDVESRPQPRLRGTLHAYSVAFFIAAGIVLISLGGTWRARIAMAAYALSLATCFGMSAVYHRGRWSPGAKRWLGRIDHSAIFVLIAGTYTPVCVLVLGGTLGTAMLIAVWSGAGAGIAMSLLWHKPPVWVEVLPYIVLGWLGVIAIPRLASTLGGGALAMLAVGGGLYTLGALIYAVKWPDPLPRTFGYHEVFHLLVVAAAVVHMVLVYIWIMPLGWS